MPVIPIPNDWAGEEWSCVIVEWPNSPQWMGLLRGLVTTPTRGRWWDGSTGDIRDAQAIGLEILERNPVASCDELVAVLEAIQVAIQNLDVSQDLQVTIQTNIQNSIDVVASSISTSLINQTQFLVAASTSQASASASAYAWSQAMAQNFVGVYIQNNIESTFRPIEPGVDPDPTAPEATPTGITSTLEDDASVELCRRVYWMVKNGRDIFEHLQAGRNYFADTILGIGSAVSDAIWVAALRADPGSLRLLIPASALVSLTHTLADLLLNEPGPGALEMIVDYFDNQFETLVCQIFQDADAGLSTGEIQSRIFDSVNVWGDNEQQAGLVITLFNLSSIAALYYVAPLLDAAPAIPVGERVDICTFCGE